MLAACNQSPRQSRSHHKMLGSHFATIMLTCSSYQVAAHMLPTCSRCQSSNILCRRCGKLHSDARYVKSQKLSWIPVIYEAGLPPRESMAYLWYKRREKMAHISSAREAAGSETRSARCSCTSEQPSSSPQSVRDFRRLVVAHEILSDPRKRTALESTFAARYRDHGSHSLRQQLESLPPLAYLYLGIYSWTFACILGTIETTA